MEDHKYDIMILAYARHITGTDTAAIESVMRAGSIAEVLYPYPKNSKAELLKSLISSFPEAQQIAKA
ncbi:MAG: hypothetical protein LAO76_21570 [Acidobacteriia bacterium]|nr:hypothetical protein [Terriglobia bacterium]